VYSVLKYSPIDKETLEALHNNGMNWWKFYNNCVKIRHNSVILSDKISKCYLTKIRQILWKVNIL